MSSKKKEDPTKETFSLKDLEPEQIMKYEIAKELGLYNKVITEGWKSLSAKESGKIGGILSSMKKSSNNSSNSTK